MNKLQIDLPVPPPPAHLYGQCALNFFTLIPQLDKSIICGEGDSLSFCCSAAGHVALQMIELH